MRQLTVTLQQTVELTVTIAVPDDFGIEEIVGMAATEWPPWDWDNGFAVVQVMGVDEGFSLDAHDGPHDVGFTDLPRFAVDRDGRFVAFGRTWKATPDPTMPIVYACLSTRPMGIRVWDPGGRDVPVALLVQAQSA